MRNRVKAIILVVCSLLLASLIAEGLARIFFPLWAPRTGRVTQFWQYDPRYGWSHIPVSSGTFHSYGFDTKVRINQKGFRGREIDYTRDGKFKRIVILGDSFVWGFGVQEEEMFTSRMEKQIPNLEIVNLGVSGYSTDQELLLYQDEGRKYKADLVVLLVAANDFDSNMQTVQYSVYGKPAFVLEANGNLVVINQPVVQTSWIKRTAVSLASYSFVLTQINRYSKHLKLTPMLGIDKEQVGLFPQSIAEEVTARLIMELKRSTAQDGVPLLVVFVDGLGRRGRIAGYLAQSDIDCLLLDEYLDHEDKSLHLPDGFHWSSQGHQIVARVLGDKIKEKVSINSSSLTSPLKTTASLN